MYDALDRLTVRIEELIKSLPDTYVSIRSYDKQITDIVARVVGLETWRTTSTQWANDEHAALKTEWQAEIKGMRNELSDINTNYVKLNTQLAVLIRILLWVVGILTTIVVSLIIAFLTHIIHF